MGEIVTYQPEYAPHFERLNREWIERHFAVEPNDIKVFADPHAAIIAHGGQIFFAVEEGGEVVGTVAVKHEGAGRYELAKLAVTDVAKGRGYGRLLSEAVIAWARQAGGHTLFITSNSVLTTAIGLYERLGFRHLPVPDGTGYARVDVYMELALQP